MSDDTPPLVYSHAGFCPICEAPTTFAARYDWYRDHLLCATCRSIPRERAAALVLSRRVPDWRHRIIHESSPAPRGLSVKLRHECPGYVASQFFPEEPLGRIVRGFRNENLEVQTFADETFDVVVALDVLEHLDEPGDAVAEIARTLKPGGVFLFTVPTYPDRVVSERRARRRPDGTIEHLAEPEYHGNPISDRGSLVTFRYGYDLPDRIHEWAGLDVEVSRFHDHGHGVIGAFTEVYVATKRPAAADSLPDEARALCEKAARRLRVSPRVHGEDGIFRFLWDNPVFRSRELAVNYYFSDGAKSAAAVREIVDRWLPEAKAPLAILEFAAGYGAVTRHAKHALAPHALHASDIHPAANAFLAEAFAVPVVQSTAVPEDLALPCEFDVVFVLSFFSHLPRRTWTRWLRRLHDGVRQGGLLVFTTHGLDSMKHFPGAELASDGYWFHPSSEQKDLDPADYGQAITSRHFVERQIATLPGVQPLAFEPGRWWGHQDLYVLRRG